MDKPTVTDEEVAKLAMTPKEKNKVEAIKALLSILVTAHRLFHLKFTGVTNEI